MKEMTYLLELNGNAEKRKQTTEMMTVRESTKRRTDHTMQF